MFIDIFTLVKKNIKNQIESVACLISLCFSMSNIITSVAKLILVTGKDYVDRFTPQLCNFSDKNNSDIIIQTF